MTGTSQASLHELPASLGLEPAAITAWYYIPAVLAAAIIGGVTARRISLDPLPFVAAQAVAAGVADRHRLPEGRRVARMERIEMHQPELHQPGLVKQVAKVNARTRPWRAIIASVLAIIAAGVSFAFGHSLKSLFEPGHLADSIATTSAAIAFFIFATIAVVAFASRARQTLQAVTGSAHAAVVRYTIVLVGAILTIVITLVLLKVPVAQLLVGGAFATIIITIAGQQSLSNIFAGPVLLLSHPFRVGDTVRLRSGALGGQHEGTVTEIGITYLQLDTGDELMFLPNSQVLAAAVSRRAGRSKPGGPDRGDPGRPSPAVRAGAAATVIRGE